MYAIVDIAGKQFKAEKNKCLYAPKLAQTAGESITLDSVLLVQDGEQVAVGTPIVSGAKVTAKVLEHVKGDKVVVFKKKRRKGYAKRQGHRQQYTKILIEDIVK